jgi:inorganic triphosphatase YgiF
MSRNDRELEIKFSTDSPGLKAAFESPVLGGVPGKGVSARSLISTYFDTLDRSLNKRRIALRVRRSGRAAPLIGVKWPPTSHSEAFIRGELEVRGHNGVPDLALLGEEIAVELGEIIGDRALEPQFETRIKRRTRLVGAGTSRIEIAFDDGEIVAGDRRARVLEVELELKSGDASELYDLAARAVEVLPFRLDVTSKSERGFRLVEGAVASPVKARYPVFTPGATIDDAIASVVGNTLAHFLANMAPLREGDDPESIHQLRVALRRMRSALGMFNRVRPCAEFDAFRAEAKRIATALGPARECDAFRDLLSAGPSRAIADPSVFAGIDIALSKRRQALYAEARQLINAKETTVFALQLQAFLTRRGWRSATGEPLAGLMAPVTQFSSFTLERLRKRVVKRGKKLVLLPDEERHKVRIALKNLRYAAEFFGALYEESGGYRTYVRTVARLQDILGAHNDAAGAQILLDGLGARAKAGTAFAAGVMLGWCERDAEIADAELGEAWRRFKRLEPFWR